MASSMKRKDLTVCLDDSGFRIAFVVHDEVPKQATFETVQEILRQWKFLKGNRVFSYEDDSDEYAD